MHSHEIKEGVSYTKRGTTIVKALYLECDGEDTAIPLCALVDDLNDLLEQIPAEHRDTAKLHIHAYGDYASAEAGVTWERPETDEELAARRRSLKSLQDEDEEHDQREFARLKKKYG